MLIEAFGDYCDIAEVFESKSEKTDRFLQLTMSELDSNKDAAELKVLQESGTQEDLEYYYSEAEQSAAKKVQAALRSVLKSFTDFISNLKTKVIKVITSTKTDIVLGKVEKKVKFNPFLAKKKVKIIDKKKPLAIIAKYRAKADKSIARVSSGVFKETEIKSIHDDIDSFDAAYKAAVAGTAALVTVSVASLIAAVKAEARELPDHIDKIDKETTAVMEKLLTTLDTKEEIAVRAAYTAVANFRTKLGQREATEHVDAIMDKLRVLRVDVLKAPEKTASKPVKESGEEGSEEFQEDSAVDLFGESVDDEFDSIFDGFMESEEEGEEGEQAYEFTAEELLEELNELY